MSPAMQPQVRYVKSADGTRLAVSTLGEGRPLVIVPAGTMTISIEGLWEIPDTRANLERLEQKCTGDKVDECSPIHHGIFLARYRPATGASPAFEIADAASRDARKPISAPAASGCLAAVAMAPEKNVSCCSSAGMVPTNETPGT